MYKNDFNTAFERTVKLGLEAPCYIECNQKTLLTYEAKFKFTKIMYSHLGADFANKLNANCLRIHSQLKKAVEKELRSKVYYTIGSLHVGTCAVYELTENAITEMLDTKFHIPSTMKIHAWLTLPTMEIVDFTLITTIAIYNKMPSQVGAVQLGNPDTMPHKYTPMLIGTDFLETMKIAFK